MAVNLTPNGVHAVVGGDVNLKPVVQVLGLKPVGGNQERYRMVLSDGAAAQAAMLATQLNDRVKSGKLRDGSVVQLIEYICSTVQGQKYVSCRCPFFG